MLQPQEGPRNNAAHSLSERERQRTFYFIFFMFLDSFQCQYVPTEKLIYMEMLFDIDSLVTAAA